MEPHLWVAAPRNTEPRDRIPPFPLMRGQNCFESTATPPPLGHKWFVQISGQWESQKNWFAFISFGKIQFLPPCFWNLPFILYRLWSHSNHWAKQKRRFNNSNLKYFYNFLWSFLRNFKVLYSVNCIFVSLFNFIIIHLLCSMCWTGQELSTYF